MRAHQDWGVRSPSVVYNITTQGLSGNPGLSMIYEHNRPITNWAMVWHKFSVALREQLHSQSYKEQECVFCRSSHLIFNSLMMSCLLDSFDLNLWKLTDSCINHSLSSSIKESGGKKTCFLFFPENPFQRTRLCMCLRNKKWGWILDALLLVLA